MKVRVTIYSEPSIGAPFSALMDPIYGDANTIADIAPLINTALTTVSPFLRNQELITMVESFSIKRWMDVVNLQTYLRENNLFLCVSEVVEVPTIPNPTEGVMIEVMSPNSPMLPITTSFYDESGQYNIVDIITEVVNKFQVGDVNLTPKSQLITLLDAIKDMQSRGLEIFPMYVDQLQSELIKYGFSLYYVYLS